MAKESGLGDGLLIGGFDLSSDAGSVGRIASPRGVLDVTGIDKFAFERLLSTKDGAIDFSSWWNPTNSHLALRSLPYTDTIVSYVHGSAIGNIAASHTAKQINYDHSRGQDGSFSAQIATQANGFGLEWGELLTPRLVNHIAPTNGASLDSGVVSTLFGLQAYLHVISFTGTTCTLTIQDSADNVAFANLTGGGFTAVTAAPTFQRIATAGNQTVRRYLRIISTGTFSSITFLINVVRNEAATVF